MKNFIKIFGKAINLLSVVVFAILLLYYFFKQHEGVNAQAFDKALMFFMGMSMSALITFGKNAYTFGKNSELVKQIVNSVNDVKTKKLEKQTEKEKASKELEKIANGNESNTTI